MPLSTTATLIPKRSRLFCTTKAQELKEFAFIDILNDDPRKTQIERLSRIGCWQNYQGNHTGAGLIESRGHFVRDLNSCLDTISDKYATKEEQGLLKIKIDALLQRVQKFKDSNSSASNQPSNSTTPQHPNSSKSEISLDGTIYRRARNLARQAAEKANGGLSTYRADSSMYNPARQPDQVNDNGVLIYRVKGGSPSSNNPSIETVVVIDTSKWVVDIEYNGPIR
jgi:hypothetical protein